mgnify:FL=1
MRVANHLTTLDSLTFSDFSNHRLLQSYLAEHDAVVEYDRGEYCLSYNAAIGDISMEGLGISTALWGRRRHSIRGTNGLLYCVAHCTRKELGGTLGGSDRLCEA